MTTTLQQDIQIAPSAQPEFQRCHCPGVLPGRACPACFSTKWLKRCPHCFGSGIVYKNTSRGEPRPEPCINCKRGWQAAMPADLRRMAAEQVATMSEPIVLVAATPQLAKTIIKGKRRKHHRKPQSAQVAAAAPSPAIPPPHVHEFVPNPAEVVDAADSSYQELN